MKVAGGFFFFLPSIIYHSASEHKIKSGKKKKDLCEREANQELWQYVKICSYVFTCQDTIYLTCALFSTYLPSRAPFFPNIYIKESKKYIKQHVSIHSKFSPKGLNKNLTPQICEQQSFHPHFKRLWLPVCPVPTVQRKVCVCWGSGSRPRHLSRGLEAAWYTGQLAPVPSITCWACFCPMQH